MLVVIAVVVAAVSIDAIGRFDERRAAKPKKDQSSISQKSIVDLSKRD